MMDLIEAGEKTQDDLDTLPLPKIPYVRTTHIFPHVEIFLAVYACALLLSSPSRSSLLSLLPLLAK